MLARKIGARKIDARYNTKKIIRSEGTISFGDMKSKMSLKLFDGIPLHNLRLLSTTLPVESCWKKT